VKKISQKPLTIWPYQLKTIMNICHFEIKQASFSPSPSAPHYSVLPCFSWLLQPLPLATNFNTAADYNTTWNTIRTRPKLTSLLSQPLLAPVAPLLLAPAYCYGSPFWPLLLPLVATQAISRHPLSSSTKVVKTLT